ncbi:MAG TPA: tRNA (adenosine(37)-N6)-threonylcarbamoyltransferase complex dimerization subunit type 1 TsaB [Erysipelotrichaceae bacterium]|nr:tRNA (adenosine(37)-N6)-threonylcarbamoyltransferase complex dimerization subunit type 1 TsaB [Erysipelotrichaceae bacterium]
MITLAIDTSFHYLTLVIYKNEEIIASVQKEAFKQQSETILVEIQNLFNQAQLKPTDLKRIVLTDGPGSYTGLRIGMTVAKVLGAMAGIEVFTLSSLHVLAGLEKDVHILLDAKAKRAYYAHFHEGIRLINERVILLEDLSDIDVSTLKVFGDGHLIAKQTYYPDYTKNFMDLKSYWKKIDDIHTLVPRYLKENEAYHS